MLGGNANSNAAVSGYFELGGNEVANNETASDKKSSNATKVGGLLGVNNFNTCYCPNSFQDCAFTQS